ncbi:MAG TPA: hypothetical protein VK901_22530, partial [Nitrospiraceae bacterium]|nr:hypothetical protein [Nitrospiraceae bacterium]
HRRSVVDYCTPERQYTGTRVPKYFPSGPRNDREGGSRREITHLFDRGLLNDHSVPPRLDTGLRRCSSKWNTGEKPMTNGRE